MKNNKLCWGGGRVYSFDTIKIVASIGVILIHFSFPGILGRIVQVLARFGVPFFFMVSGYFCYKPYSKFSFGLARKKIIHILKILVVAVSLYSIYYIYDNGIEHMLQSVTLSNLLKLIIFNAPQIVSAHLWFLFALMYSYYLLALFLKILNGVGRGQEDSIIYIAGGLLLIHIFFAEILPQFGCEMPHPIVRNAFLFGLPFVSIGFYIHKKENEFKELRSITLIVIAIIGSMAAILEWKALRNNDLLELYVGSIITSFSVFLLALKNKDIGKNTKINYIGRHCSMVIYIVHILIGNIICKDIEIQNIVYAWIRPLLIIICSIIVSFMYGLMLEHFKWRINDLKSKFTKKRIDI